MKTTLLVTIKKNKEFNLEEFLQRFKAETKRLNAGIDELENFNKAYIPQLQPDDYVEYIFKTDYAFITDNIKSMSPEEKFKKIYPRLEEFKQWFNNRNKAEIRSIVIIGEPN